MGKVSIIVLNALNFTFPTKLLNITKKYAEPLDFNIPTLTFIFLGANSSSIAKLGFAVTHESINNSNYSLPSLILPHDVMVSNEVKSIPSTGPSITVGATFQNEVLLNNEPAGNYYLHVTVEFYDEFLGMPILVKSFTFSLPFLELSWE